MRENIERHSEKVYRRVTRDTFTGTWGAAIVLKFALVGVASLMYGILFGASTALDGGTVAPHVSEMAAIETEVWLEMQTETSPVGRVVYGLFHWIVVYIVWLGIAGVQIGYAAPVTGHVVKVLAEPLIWGLALLFMLQLVRTLELAYHEFVVDAA